MESDGAPAPPRPLVARARRALRTATAPRPVHRIAARIARELTLATDPEAHDEQAATTVPSAQARRARERWDTSAASGAAASEERPAPSSGMRLNRLCSLEDWDDPALVATIRRLLPFFVEDHADFPRGREHRKHWEYAHLLLGLDRLGALHRDALVLGVGAGHEDTLYDLTRWVRWVFATDVYGLGQFQALEGDGAMLVDPERFARCAYNRNRLVVQYMDARDLRYEDGTFDAAFSSGSIEHVGGFAGAVRAIAEMGRVVKPGGVVGFTTECVVNGAAPYSEPGLELFTPATLAEMIDAVPALVPVEPLDTTLTARTAALTAVPLAQSLAADQAERDQWPHLLVERQGRVFTSVAVFLRRES